jgi:hypothetical protein
MESEMGQFFSNLSSHTLGMANPLSPLNASWLALGLTMLLLLLLLAFKRFGQGGSSAAIESILKFGTSFKGCWPLELFLTLALMLNNQIKWMKGDYSYSNPN